ncbi:hypothetical protein BN439_3094 [Erwinia amylovora Ea644]|nr:hypothetical protein BN439_3094 [Erwinia amylovora Ea644]
MNGHPPAVEPSLACREKSMIALPYHFRLPAGYEMSIIIARTR